ncbi:MAG: hypothetical protein QOD41_3030 [Cryptosporangiaceae bacterium]|nr:hypothetical protein [Cryptosporangiaceae bacterium]
MRKRYYSAPENIGAAGGAAAVAAAVYPAFQHATGFGFPCLLRTVTGIPCPLCGMTTAGVYLVRGNVVAAATANPFVFAVAALVATGLVLLAARVAGRLPDPEPWPASKRRKCAAIIGALAAVSWAYQLHRFDYF